MSIDLKNIEKKKNRSAKEEAPNPIAEFFSKDIKLFKGGVKDKKKERLYSDLHILLTSGIDIKTALELIVDEQKKEDDKALFLKIKEDVLNGKSFSEAINETDKFSNYEYYSLKIGEESGRLPDVLVELSSFYNKKIKQKRQIVNAFSYPLMVLFTALAAVIFMMNFVVPMFVDVFNRFQGELPAITQFIINLSEAFSKYMGLVSFMILVIVFFLWSQKKKLWYRKISSNLLMRLPLIGGVVKKIYVARYCQSMALLIASRTPMLQAIQLVKNMIGFYPYEVALEKISDDIMKGKSLHESMMQFSLFDNRIISLIKVAEEVNQLDKIFDRLNHQYSEEMDHQIGMLSGLLEPIMIIFVGGLVAVILVAMYLPLFQLSTSIY